MSLHLPLILLSIVGLACNRQGVSSSVQIVGGDEVQDDNDPISQATLALLMPQNQQAFCTATVVGYQKSKNRQGLLQIVTAGHCIDHPQGQFADGVVIGKGYIPEALNAKVSWLSHPMFNSDMVTSIGPGSPLPAYDIAVIVARGDLNEEQGRRYLAAQIGDIDSAKDGRMVVQAGYGMLDSGNTSSVGRLRKVANRIEKNYQAQKEWTTSTPLAGTCQGDSGGPTFLDENWSDSLTLIGATSRGSQRCSDGQGIYTDVTRFQGWIKCAFEAMGAPLAGLSDDDSGEQGRAEDCKNLKIRTAEDPAAPPSRNQGQGGNSLVADPNGGGFPDNQNPCPPGFFLGQDPYDGQLYCFPA